MIFLLLENTRTVQTSPNAHHACWCLCQRLPDTCISHNVFPHFNTCSV